MRPTCRQDSIGDLSDVVHCVVLFEPTRVHRRKRSVHQGWKAERVSPRTLETSHDDVGGFESQNYIYACEIGIVLTLEYTRRYGKVHTCAEHLMWLRNHHPSHFEERRSETAYYSVEGIPECMPEQYRCPSVVDAYQMYYMMEKMGFARYKDK